MRSGLLPLAIVVSLLCCAAACGAGGSPPKSQASGEPATRGPAVEVDQSLALARQKNSEPMPTVAGGVTAEPAALPPLPADPQPPSSTARAATREPSDRDVAQALLDATAGKHAAVKARLVRALPRLVREATLEDRLLAHALLGRAYASSNETKRAEGHYANVLAGWREPSQGVAQVTAGDEPDDVKTARVSQALNAVGEALFFRAEQHRKRADALRPPAFQGGHDEAAVVRHIDRRVTPWLVKRRALVDEAEAAYRKVLDVQPVPPPHWIVASASQVAAMLELLRRDLEGVPISDKIRKEPKFLGIYQEALADSLAPLLEAARAADRLCVDMARKYAVKNEYSERCTARLAAAPP